MTDLTPVMKDRLILVGWIAGLVIVITLLWSLTFHFRATLLMSSANKVLVSMEDQRRLLSPLPRAPAESVPMGHWYRLLESGSLFFIFGIMRDGILIPCGAEITEEGKVSEIIPLSSHARKAIGHIPQGVIDIYIQRIESAMAAAKEKK
jgi:hypothetical protein